MVIFQTKKMKVLSAFILQSLMFYFRATAKNIYVKNNSIVTLECDFRSTSHSLIWLGPQHLVVYTDGELINRNIKKFRRLVVSGDHEAGQYDLVIKNFTHVDEGLYKCNTLHNGKTQEGTYTVKIKKPPTNLRIESFNTNMYNNHIYVEEHQNSTMTCNVNPGIPAGQLMLLSEEGTVVATGTHSISYIFEAGSANYLTTFTCKVIHECFISPLEILVKVIVYTIPQVQIRAYPSASPGINQTLKIACGYSSNHPRVSVSLEKVKENNTQMLPLQSKSFEISQLKRKDSGIYRCKAINPAGAGTDQINIIIRYKPILLTEGDAQYVYTDVGLPVDITFYIESFETPTVSWLSSTLQGKRGNWKLQGIDKRIYVFSSTILPHSREHFGRYKARIRNSAGMVDADIQLFEDNTSISFVPSSVVCNISSAIRISCCLNDETYRVWKGSWMHFRQGTLVRYIKGRTVKNVSILEIDFCDFQDEGNYVCTWSRLRRHVSAEIHVDIQSEPIVTRKLIQTNHSYVTLKVMFYSYEYPKKPTWYYNLNDELEEIDIVSSLINVDIEIQCYGQSIHENGYQASLIIKKLAASKLTDLSCQLLNSFGRVESTFKDTDIQREVHNSNFQLSTKYRSSWTTDIQKDTISKQHNKIETVHLYAIVSGGVVVLLVILFASSMIVILKTYNQGYLHPKVETRSQQQHNEGITDHVYEDIDTSGIEPPSQEPYDEMVIYGDNGPIGDDGANSNTAIPQHQSLYESIKDIQTSEERELTSDTAV